MRAVIGTAGWSIPRNNASAFPTEGTALERYSRLFDGVEVNSSFYRPHRASTWARWAASVPDGFRFSVKIPKTITHLGKLRDLDPLADFARDIAPLGAKLAVLLVQLPPKLAFEAEVAERFFSRLRQMIDADIVCEPRNPSWFEDEANGLLDGLRIGRVAADPAPVEAAARPGGWLGLPYWRLHGSPVMYRSPYNDAAIDNYAQQISGALAQGRRPWCVFDNTAASAATGNALSLLERLGAEAG